MNRVTSSYTTKHGERGWVGWGGLAKTPNQTPFDWLDHLDRHTTKKNLRRIWYIFIITHTNPKNKIKDTKVNPHFASDYK